MSGTTSKNLCDDCGEKVIQRCPIEPTEMVHSCINYWRLPDNNEILRFLGEAPHDTAMHHGRRIEPIDHQMVLGVMKRIENVLEGLDAHRTGESASLHFALINDMIRAISAAIAVLEGTGEPTANAEPSTDAIVQERGDSYGHPIDHHGKVAAMYLTLTGDGVVNKAEHVEIMWALDKLVRMSHNDFCDSPTNRDASSDTGGYADKCLKMVWDRRAELAKAGAA